MWKTVRLYGCRQKCGVSIQRQWPAMLADCAHISIWVSVSWYNAPNNLIWECTLRKSRRGIYLKLRSPKLNLNTTRQHFRPLLLDRHPTWLCLDDIFFSILEGDWPLFDFACWGAFFIKETQIYGQIFLWYTHPS